MDNEQAPWAAHNKAGQDADATRDGRKAQVQNLFDELFDVAHGLGDKELYARLVEVHFWFTGVFIENAALGRELARLKGGGQ